MRRRSTHDGGSNFWPGYVDAMVNVVLNLLFLVAMFAISAAVLGSNKGTPPLVYSATGDDLPGPVGGWPHGPQGSNDTRTSATQHDLADSAQASLLSQAPSALTSSALTEGTPDSALARPQQGAQVGRLGGRDTSRDEVIYISSSESVVVPSAGQLRAARAGGAQARESDPQQGATAVRQSEVAATSSNNQTQYAGINGKTAQAAAAERPDGALLLASPLPTASIQVSDVQRAMGASRARVMRRELPTGQLFMIDLPAGVDPVLEMSRPQMIATLRTIAPVSDRQNLQVWTIAPAEEGSPVRRFAYLALAGLRNALVAQGWPTSEIDMRLALGALPKSGNLRLYLNVRNTAGADSSAVSVSAGSIAGSSQP